MRVANKKMPPKKETETYSDYLRRCWGEDQWQRWRASWMRGTPIPKNQSEKMIKVLDQVRAEWAKDLKYYRSVIREYYDLD